MDFHESFLIKMNQLEIKTLRAHNYPRLTSSIISSLTLETREMQVYLNHAQREDADDKLLQRELNALRDVEIQNRKILRDKRN